MVVRRDVILKITFTCQIDNGEKEGNEWKAYPVCG